MTIYLFSFFNSILHLKKLFFAIISILLIIYPIHLIQAAENEEPKQVLIFFSYPLGTPWQDKISEVIYEELHNNSKIKTNILSEFPWSATNYDDNYAELLIEFYKYKYKNTKIDIILATSVEASIFLIKHGDTLFPNIPIISISSTPLTEQYNMKPNWTGIIPKLKIKDTIDTALNLQPKTQNIAIISGSAPGDQIQTNKASVILQENYTDFNLIYLTDIPMDEIIQKVSNLPSNTIALYLLTLADSTGKNFIPKEILKDITKAANVPVYALWDTLIGSGVVGGYVISTEVEGKILTDIAFSILEGEKIENIPVEKDLNAYIFNWSQLKKWNINKEDLPPGSIILNREYTFWDKYKTQIIITILVVIIEAFLIFILLVQQSRLKTVRKSLTESHIELENKVLIRTNDLTGTNKKLVNEIIDHKKAKDHIQLLLEEKEIILKEVHHRVKNNLATTMSLLSLQSANLKNPEAIEALETAENRVRSMMILYDKLYKSTEFQIISVTDYFTTLVTEIVQNFKNPGRIHIKTEIEDFQMDVKTVFNLGIIINELITNTMKYAFPENKEGKIFLSIVTKERQVLIIIQDDGIGLPEDINFDSPKSFGMSLVKMLTEQLGGTIQIEKGNGTKIILEIAK